jgi:uncharacterized protein (TIGR03032 family)
MSMSPTDAASDKGPVLLLSPRFSDWLASADVCLSLTTYQAGRLFFIGRKADGGVRAHERIIEQCQGLWTHGQTLWTSGLYMLWRFENVLRDGEITPAGADRKFVPLEGRVVGRIDTHDIGIGEVDGVRRPIFVNTLYGCLATISETASFRPLWRPKFLTALVPEDRCHLNGLAMDGVRPALVSAVSRSDVADGWRDRRHDGGIVIDVATGEIVASGFSMPHSPRLYDGKLWLLNSGAGEFGTINPADGTFDRLALLWQILSSAGFPNQFFNDSWVVGFWRGRPWLARRWIGRTSLDVGSSRFWIGWVIKRGGKCVRSTYRG